MGVEVCTVWAPRRTSQFNYLGLLDCQRRSCKRFEHVHRVMTDADLPGFNAYRTALPESLMKAMIAGVIERLKLGGNDHIVFVDVDCLVARRLESAFDTAFDLGITNRINAKSPINNGAMYVSQRGIPKALPFFERALELCGDHWGGDQEAISAAAAPVPDHSPVVEVREGLALAFLSMRQYNNAPKYPFKAPFCEPYILHFKGDGKHRMAEYQHMFHLG